MIHKVCTMSSVVVGLGQPAVLFALELVSGSLGPVARSGYDIIYRLQSARVA